MKSILNKTLSYQDFSALEIQRIESIVNGFKGLYEAAEKSRLNWLSATTLQGISNKLYLVYLATNKIIQTPFANVLSIYKYYVDGLLISLEMPLTKQDDSEIYNDESVQSFIKSVDEIHLIISNKLIGNIDIPEASLQVNIKTFIEQLYSTINRLSQDYLDSLNILKNESYRLEDNELKMATAVAQGIGFIVAPVAPFTKAFSAISNVLQVMYTENKINFLNSEYSYVKEFPTRIDVYKADLKRYLLMIRNDGYDFDFSTLSVIEYKAVAPKPDPTPNPHTNVKPFSAPKSNAPYAIAIALIFFIFIITRKRYVNT